MDVTVSHCGRITARSGTAVHLQITTMDDGVTFSLVVPELRRVRAPGMIAETKLFQLMLRSCKYLAKKRSISVIACNPGCTTAKFIAIATAHLTTMGDGAM